MRGLRVSVFLALVASTSLLAELLPPGKFGLYQNFGFTTHSGVWQGLDSVNVGASAPVATPIVQVGSKAKTKSRVATQATNSTTNGDGKVNGFLSNTTISAGFDYGIQLDARAQYKYVQLVGSNERDRKNGDSVGGFSELGFRLNKQLITSEPGYDPKWGIIGFVGFRSPGNASDSGDDFLALNDGTSKFDLGVDTNVNFGHVGLELELTGILRTNVDLASQTRIAFSVPVYAVQGITFGPALTYFHSWGGIDIADPDFVALETQNGLSPYTMVKEEYLSLGLFLAVPLNEQIILDGSFQRKVLGRNSDIGTFLGAGVGVTF